MAHIVPLIRTGALMPMVRWMAANKRPVRELLQAADLGYLSMDEPDQPIPLLNGVAFLREAGRREGPDIAVRMVSPESIPELGLLGKAAIGAQTPREALNRIIALMPQHCTHELITMTPHPAGAVVREGWTLLLEDEALHLVQQYVAALVAVLVGGAAIPPSHLARTQMVPHPVAGLAHLRHWFGDVLEPAADRSLEVFIEARVLDRRIQAPGRDRTMSLSSSTEPPLRGDGSLAWTSKIALKAMLAQGQPTVDRLARAAGTSHRTLQRRLAEEGTSFSALVEDVRSHAALRQLAVKHSRLGDLSANLGYAHQATFSRAVRRWTGKPPRSFGAS